jgi:HSP20 family protein
MKTKRKETTTALQRPETGFFDEMDRAFDTLMHRGWLRPFRDLWPEWQAFETDVDVQVPRVDLIDREAEILVRAEVPGIDKEHLEVDLTGELLTIRGERRKEEKTEEGNVYRAEIARGTFVRTLRLPAEVDADKVEATFENGLLEIHLPKLATTKRQRIELK